jgi:hypothetical protein
MCYRDDCQAELAGIKSEAAASKNAYDQLTEKLSAQEAVLFTSNDDKYASLPHTARR